MRFDEALRYLLSLGHETLTIKLGLRNTELLLAALGNPSGAYPKVQIAGTNGKGSTAVVLDSVCRAAGIKSGLFTSPHLVSITERIRINGRDITEVDFACYASMVRAAAEKLVNTGTIPALPTFFEHVTAIALIAFREARVEIAILETGLGGRLDSTTAAGADLVAITPIDLDHSEYLGDTLESIAAEKAAIIRPGVQAIVAHQHPRVLREILLQCKRSRVTPSIDDCEASIDGSSADGRFSVTFKTPQYDYAPVRLGLRGRHQITNVALAVRLAESLRDRGFDIPLTAITHGIELARHPGRLELLHKWPRFLLDGAHNVSGALALRDYLDEFVKSELTIVFGVMRDKNVKAIATLLFPKADCLVLVTPDSPRAAKAEWVKTIATSDIDPTKIIVAGPPQEAIEDARMRTPRDGLICITGSLYFIGQVRNMILNSTDNEQGEAGEYGSKKGSSADHR